MNNTQNYSRSSSNTPQDYQMSQCGPWGMRLNEHMQKTTHFNVPFDNLQWEEVKLNGCHGRPCRPLPQWPPPKRNGFIYPTLADKDTNPQFMGTYGYGNNSVFMNGKPFLEPSDVRPQRPQRKQRYTPQDILGSKPISQPLSDANNALPHAMYRSMPLSTMNHTRNAHYGVF